MFGNHIEELLKKNHTYDTEGNLIEVKGVKTDYLPSINYSNIRTKYNGPEHMQVKQSEANKRLKNKIAQLNPNVEYLQREFNVEINKIFSKDN